MKHLILLLFATNLVFAQRTPTIPAKTNNLINDYANVLSSVEEEDLRELARAIQTESTTQVVVYTTDEIDKDYPLEDFSIALAQKWGIGQRGADNGVLLLVCPKNRQSRIEVGYGLEGILTDAYTKKLQVENFRPNFKKYDFHAGLRAAMMQIKSKIAGSNVVKTTQEVIAQQQTQSVQTPIVTETPKEIQVVSPEVEELRRQVAIQKEKDSAEATASFWNFMLWFSIIGLIGGLIAYYIYKDYAEKKRIADERKAKEDAIRFEKERIQNNAEREERTLEEKARNIISTLKLMGDFYNAKEVLLNVTKIYEKAIADLNNATFMEYENICRPALNEILSNSKTLVDNYAVKEKVEKNFKTYESSKDILRTKLNQATTNGKILINSYDQTIWTNFDLINDFIKRVNIESVFSSIDDQHNIARNTLNVGDFTKAAADSQKALVSFDYYQEMAKMILDKETEIRNAIAQLNSYNTTTKIADRINEVTRYLKSNYSDISNHLRNEWNNFASKHNHFTVNVKSANPVQELQRVTLFLDNVKNYLNRATQEVTAAERQRREEKRRKEEQEERERQHQRDLITAAAIVSSSSRRNDDDDNRISISSSSDDNMGGGSFGGGGSNDTW